ncbi:heme peroxidase [Truncatella angustata]|uniref:Peroxidase n=1 Tax=Truncatella angustata TaxID=152316 RepID=A0A9P8UIX8_9PEZI|nr:heme peroxidase [Truncatella angustata]KAH6653037.1 heme peroxidase [Truncatella angustata]
MYSLVFTLASVPLFAGVTNAILDGIDARDVYEEMEHIFVDNSGTNSDGFINAVTPCSNYFQDRSGIEGEQSSAQWVRLAFHDFITADIAAGTGGLDGSIAYEGNRAENVGLFINDTLGFMLPTINAYLSMADNIALGLVAALSTCSGDSTGIQIRAGRTDAIAAGPSGVPEPTTGLEETLAQFAAAGFTQEDAIVSTACGHSLGRIHYTNFPDIVDKSAVTGSNTHGGVGFDGTPADFDSSVVNEYLDGTGTLGGPLITAPNVDDRSDLRLYNSDSNATMESISEEATFRSSCFDVFERMINTVPAGSSLTEPITPMAWKAIELATDINSQGVVSIGGRIRNLYNTGSSPSTVSYTVSSDAGDLTATSATSSGTGTSLFGKTTYYNFNTSIESPGTTSLAFGDVTYPINDNIFVLPVKSTTSGRNSGSIKAAVLTSLISSDGLKVVLYVPGSVSGTRARRITTQTVAMTQYSTAGEYTLYQASVSGNIGSGSGTIVKVVMGDLSSPTVKVDIFG